jgi:hypothetical protein
MVTCSQEHSALATAVRHTLVVAGVLLGCLAAVPQAAADPVGAAPAALPFRSEPPLRSYVAVRRLESRNERHHKEAWLVARTELRADGTFRYEVLEEGGSEFIRTRVLCEAWEKEAAVHRKGRTRRSSLTHDNYEFAEPTPVEGGMRVAIAPRRKDDMLLTGALVMSPEGELLRVEGELVKRPSFWTRSVHVVRRYGRIGGTRVPVRLDTTAQVRLAGRSTMSMTYEYVQINGRPVEDGPVTYTHTSREPRPASRPAPQR